MGEIASAQERYLAKYRELIALEQKQEQVVSLQEKLAATSEEREAVMQTLTGPAYEDKQRLIIEFEEMARAIGVQQSLEIIKDITQEEIQQEKEQLARSRRGSEEARKATVEEKFPGIVLGVSITGEYTKIIEFLETLRSLPYYTFIEGVSVSSVKRAQEGQPGIVTASMEVTVFTRE